MARARAISVSANWCHICGLLIPDGIVYPYHCLYGTIDHVVPLSKGGSNEIENRRAAHNFCNRVKANRDLADVDRHGLQGKVKAALEQIGVPCGRAAMRRARERVGLNPATNHGKGKVWHLPLAIQGWENEGGFIMDHITKHGQEWQEY